MRSIKKNKLYFVLFLLTFCLSFSQVNTSNPYSRFGLGELNQSTLAHNQGMGGAFTALKPDSIFPVMINTGNPASYSLIRFACFEVGGFYGYSQLQSNNIKVNKHHANFSYAVLGFPVRKNGGASFGIMPFTNVGYSLQAKDNITHIGDVTYNYAGEGGFNKVFLGYGVMPFKNRLTRFRKKINHIQKDTASNKKIKLLKVREFTNELLSDFSAGANANYLFGSTKNYAEIRYPNSAFYYNTIREQIIRINDFTGNIGMQTAFTIDSLRKKIKTDSLGNNINKKVALREKIKFVFGWYMNINNSLTARRDLFSYNYYLTPSAGTIPRDTIINKVDEYGIIKLPLEQGFGIGIKKGERLNIVLDYAITNWSSFKLFEYTNTLKNNSRYALGFNYVPEKFATGKGTYFKRSQYRAGAFYQTGYLDLNQSLIASYGITAGISLPVGNRTGTGLINFNIQAGQNGTNKNGLVKENFVRVFIGFTFNSTYFDDLWFRKFKYD